MALLDSGGMASPNALVHDLVTGELRASWEEEKVVVVVEQLDDLSGYLLASRVRDLLEHLQPELAVAGIPVGSTTSAQGAWRDLDEVLAQLSALLEMPR